jgi:hypothetical protein
MYLIFFQSVKRFTVKRLSSTQQVAKKHLKRHVKRLRDREYTRLRQMVPSIAENEKVSKVNTLFLYVCFVDRCLSFGTFSFGHCVICSSSIYRFWLPLWYLHTLLNSSNMTCLIGSTRKRYTRAEQQYHKNIKWKKSTFNHIWKKVHNNGFYLFLCHLFLLTNIN